MADRGAGFENDGLQATLQQVRGGGEADGAAAEDGNRLGLVQ